MVRKVHEVRELFAALEGNARVIVVTEGIAAVTFRWYSTYLPLYMLAMGVSKVQVGMLASALIFTQFISTLLIVEAGKLYRVTSIAQLNKARSFYHPPIFHIKAGNNPFS